MKVGDVFSEENIRRTYSTRIFSGPTHAHHDHEHA